MKQNHLKIRTALYFVGLFVMTIGIALSVKSNLGVSPVSSIPYTMTCVWGIEMGKATILFHVVLVLLQILLLRRKFKPAQLLQVLVGVIFGYFTTFCNYMVSFLPTPENLVIRVGMVLASTVFVAIGIFFYLPADLIPLAGEGAMQAVSSVTGIEFPKVKIGFDCTMVLVSVITCLTCLHSLGSVGAGTVIAAVLVGTLVGVLKNGAEIAVDSISNGWAHIMDNSSGSGRYCSAAYLTRMRDYVSGDEDNDPIQPPRTSHIDGVKTVIIDPGHGGSDVGANNGGSLDEKHVNLYVAQYLKQYLEAAGAKVIMVRDTLEEGSELTLRGAVMKQYASSADLFFSIHHNAANTTARGAEILAQIADKNGGPTKILAQALLDEYEKLGVPIRQIVFREGSHGDYYYTNRAAAALNIPALTSEFCFIDNEEDQKFIDSEEDWQKQARAQCNAILYYFTQVQY